MSGMPGLDRMQILRKNRACKLETVYYNDGTAGGAAVPFLCVKAERHVMKLENNLGTDPIRPLVWRIAIPSMLAQFVSVLYSIVDRIYISNIPLIGDTALAGVGVCGPVVTMIGAFASFATAV